MTRLPLHERVAHVLAQLGPAGDVEEADLLLPLLGLAVLPAAVDGQPEGGDRLAADGVKRSSGSRVTLPTTVTVLSAMS